MIEDKRFMRTLKLVWATFALLALFAAPSVASQRTAYERAYLRGYAEVVQRHGVKTAGCNLVTNKYHNRCHGKASRHRVMKSSAVIRRMLYVPSPPTRTVTAYHPAPAAATATHTTSNAPNTTSGNGYAGGNYSIPSSIVMCESGGNYRAVNPSSGAGGAYQILPSTWRAYGGTGSPQNASPAQQDAIAAKVWNGQGRGAWVC